MNEIDILEMRDMWSQQTRQLSAELEAVKRRLPEPTTTWWEIVSGILAAMLLAGLSFIGGVLFHLYLFDVPCN